MYSAPEYKINSSDMIYSTQMNIHSQCITFKYVTYMAYMCLVEGMFISYKCIAVTCDMHVAVGYI